MGTPHRRTFKTVSGAFGLGGRGGNEGRSTRHKNELKLSEIIVEINDLHEVRPRPRLTKTGTLAVFISHRMPLTLIPNFQRASAEALLT
jgi:hypothetical protein